MQGKHKYHTVILIQPPFLFVNGLHLILDNFAH